MGKGRKGKAVPSIAPNSNWLRMKATVLSSKKTSAKCDLKTETVLQKKRELKKQKRQLKHENDLQASVDTSNIVAMDCEMVGVGLSGDRSVLARCSIVDYNGQVLYDEIVRPNELVTDFRTHVSGIRSSTLRDGITLHQCQKDVGKLLKGKILVGHALKNDFQALMFDHPKHLVRDTARYRPYMRRRGTGTKLHPRSLKSLAEEFLSSSIQTGEHDSVEDARSTMELYRRVGTTWEKYVKATNFHGGLIGTAPPALQRHVVASTKPTAPVVQLETEEEHVIEQMLNQKPKAVPANGYEATVTTVSEFDASDL